MERFGYGHLRVQEQRATASTLALSLLFAVFGIVLAGCSQSVDTVSIQPINPPPVLTPNYITHTDLQGTSFTAPTSTTRRLGIHSFGGSNERTISTSGSFRMTSGIGVD